MTRFANPWVLALLVTLPFLVLAWRLWVVPRRPRVRFSNLRLFEDVKPSLRQRLRGLPLVLRVASLALLIVALARPQAGATSTNVETEGIDIILTIDISGSMNAVDMTPETRGATPVGDVSRLDVAKNAAREFIQGRTTDRIGLVIFAGQALTQCPPTLDYNVLLRFLDDVHVGMLEDNTAIGTALVTTVNRLRQSDAKSRVVILLTDGANNAGTVDPITAAKVAKAVGIKVYCITAGRDENARFPVETFFGRQYVRQHTPIDEKTMRQIADITGGMAFRATSPEKLTAIYQQIGDMEQTKMETKEYVEYSELAGRLVIPALLLLLLEGLLGQTWFRRLA